MGDELEERAQSLDIGEILNRGFLINFLRVSAMSQCLSYHCVGSNEVVIRCSRSSQTL